MALTYVVVDNVKRWDLRIAGTEVISANQYLTEARFADAQRARIFNMSRTGRYQGAGYYVSLLATARGHHVLPDVNTIQDLRNPALIDLADEDLQDLIDRSLGPLKSDEFELSIYLGRNLARRYDRLSRALFQRFRAPLMRAHFKRGKRWHLEKLRQISTGDVPESHVEFVSARAEKYFSRRKPRAQAHARYDLAILVDPKAKDAPSDPRAITRFISAARELSISAQTIEKNDLPSLAEFDALFIRETTAVNHYTYRFASRAEAEGMVVIDDPTSIIRCSNKVYLADLFARNYIPCPTTMIVHRGNRSTVASSLALPCILKRPDSAFSTGVVKATTPDELEQHLDQFLQDSDLVVAQSFTPTDFDWRIGVLDGKPLWACKYYMASGHWQIRKQAGGSTARYGRVETLPVHAVPPRAVELAVRSAALIGNGLYGVDLKEWQPDKSGGGGSEFLLIEINDNPNLDSDVEDRILKDELYLEVMRSFFNRLEKRGRAVPRRP